jgi:fermentation-respiration switch protein FrsA (DUF1100 family)
MKRFFLVRAGLRFLLLFFVAYSIFCLTLFFLQKHLIFFPSDQYSSPPSEMGVEEVSFVTHDGVQLWGWYVDVESSKTALFFHGNAGNISDRTDQVKVFRDLGINALLFDYRGYGKSKGKIVKEEDLYLDAEAALRYLLEEKEIPIRDVIFWGRSLGGAIAIEMATRHDVLLLIVESTFTSIKEMAKRNLWYIPIDLLLRYHFDSFQKSQSISTRTLVIHSTDDEMIPFDYGRRLFKNLLGEKYFLEIRGSHNYGFIQSKDTYLSGIRNFLQHDSE